MSFTSAATLKKNLGTKFIESFEVANPDVIAGIVVQIDKIITRYTGIQPPAEPAADQEELQLCAAWIAFYLMTPFQGGLTTDEKDSRRKDFEQAIKMLRENEAVTNGSTFTVMQAAGVNNKRIGELP